MMRQTIAPFAMSVLLLASTCIAVQPGSRADGLRRDRTASVQESRLARDEVIEFVQRHFPERAQKLEELRRTDRERYLKERRQLMGKIQRLMELEKNNPRLFALTLEDIKLERKLNQLARTARESTDDGARARYRKELEVAVLEAFELRARLKQAELDDLEAQVDELRASLKRREERREELVSQRVEQLLKEDLDDW
jgi:hypothetical protein